MLTHDVAVGRERLKYQREKDLAIALSGGSASSSASADPNALSAVVEGKLRAHFNVKKQAAQATGSGNPHMQIMGKNADLVFAGQTLVALLLKNLFVKSLFGV